jgi:hypothetical protein
VQVDHPPSLPEWFVGFIIVTAGRKHNENFTEKGRPPGVLFSGIRAVQRAIEGYCQPSRASGSGPAA